MKGLNIFPELIKNSQRSMRFFKPATSAYDLFHHATAQQIQEIHFKNSSQLQGIICLSDLGNDKNKRPALGGCRFVEYQNFHAAAFDAMRLAKGMAFKSALAGINLGGGKAVILKPKNFNHDNRKEIFEQFGDFVNELNGKYITAMDSGTSVADMDIIAKRTPYVASDSDIGDPSFYTALGLFQGLLETVKFKYAKSCLANMTIAIQGAGNVSYHFAKLLHQQNVKIIITDIEYQKSIRFMNEFNAQFVEPQHIYDVACDVFSPCALGGILNEDTVERIKAKVIAGAANNQLSSLTISDRLAEKKILLAPDYVINAGGLIYAAGKFLKMSALDWEHKINTIPATLLKIYQQSEQSSLSPMVYANTLALQKIQEDVKAISQPEYKSYSYPEP